MRRWRSLIIDAWGALAYKPAFEQVADGRSGRLPGHAGASWATELGLCVLRFCPVEHVSSG